MINRRDFLVRSSSCLVTGATWVTVGGVSLKIGAARAQTKPGQVLVKVFQRGGADGLYLCAPHADSEYYTWRPDVHVVPPNQQDPEAALALSSANHPNFFGLNPNLGAMMEIYEDGNLAIMPATHLRGSNRSHFDNQRWIGTGEIGGLSTGWMAKVLSTSSNPSVFRGLQAGDTSLTAELRGDDAYPAVRNVSDYELEESEWCVDNACQENILLNHLIDAYTATGQGGLAVNTLTSKRGLSMIESLQEFAALESDYVPDAGGLDYSNSGQGRGLRLVAQLLKSDIPLECVSISWGGGWDSHSNQRPRNSSLSSNSGLHRAQRTGAEDLLTFHRDLKSAGLWDRVCVVIGSEFGRTTKQNGSQGTDHGYAACWWAMGGPVKGGEIHGAWPGLQENQLNSGRFLEASIDCRDLLGEALVKHMEFPENQLSQVFPNHSFTDNAVFG